MHPSRHCARVCRWRASRSRARSPQMHQPCRPRKAVALPFAWHKSSSGAFVSRLSLIYGFCSSSRDFTLSFLRTPPHDDALALWLTFGSADTWYRNLHPTGFMPCTAHTFSLRGRPSTPRTGNRQAGLAGGPLEAMVGPHWLRPPGYVAHLPWQWLPCPP